MKISNYSVFIFASFLFFVSMGDLSARRIGAVTVQETQQAVDAVLNETTPKFNFHNSCGADCSDDTYCRKHNRFRPKKRINNDTEGDNAGRNKNNSSQKSRCRTATSSSCSKRSSFSSCGRSSSSSSCGKRSSFSSCGR